MSKVHLECVGESRSVLSTLDKLKRIELKMELLTRELEQMPGEKVAIAQKVRVREGFLRIWTNLLERLSILEKIC